MPAARHTPGPITVSPDPVELCAREPHPRCTITSVEVKVVQHYYAGTFRVRTTCPKHLATVTPVAGHHRRFYILAGKKAGACNVTIRGAGHDYILLPVQVSG